MNNADWFYLMENVWGYLSFQKNRCPYCDSDASRLVNVRRGIIQIRRCNVCNLMFRYPKDSTDFNKKFYQSLYSEGATTDMPSPDVLAELKRTNFQSENNFTEKINLLKSILDKGTDNVKVLDYGASWGYATYQLNRAGFEAIGFEMSKPRASYGEQNLGVTIISELGTLKSYGSSFDVIFTSHVIEHIPTPHQVFDTFNELLKSDGILLAFVPNDHGTTLGKHHLISLNKEFCKFALPKHNFENVVCFSNPYKAGEIREMIAQNQDGDISGHELMIYAKKSNRKS
jgi:2-polyprenyl-3-methyl-5-hydroxy-6-metoxy-1,4-benzoquinol methylase